MFPPWKANIDTESDQFTAKVGLCKMSFITFMHSLKYNMCLRSHLIVMGLQCRAGLGEGDMSRLLVTGFVFFKEVSYNINIQISHKSTRNSEIAVK